jgi:hypothetical protein
MENSQHVAFLGIGNKKGERRGLESEGFGMSINGWRVDIPSLGDQMGDFQELKWLRVGFRAIPDILEGKKRGWGNHDNNKRS